MGRIIAGFFVLLAAAGLFWGSWASLQSTLKFRATAVAVEGTVVDLERRESSSDGKRSVTYAPVVEYATPGGTSQFTGSTASNPPSYDRGDKVKVLYAEANPENARIDGFADNWLLPIILGGIGLVAALIGWFLFVGGLKKRSVRKWLATNGMKVKAKLLGVEQNTSLAVNGRHPWRLRAQWQHPVSQKVYVLMSDNYWYDPTDYVKGDQVDALVNADDPRQYMLDTSFLPAKG